MSQVVMTNAVYEPDRSEPGEFTIRALPGGGISVEIPDKVVPEGPLHIFSYAAAEDAEFRPRIEIVAGVSTRLRLIVEHIGLVRRYLRHIETEIHLKPNACVNFIDIYRPGAEARGTSRNHYHLDHHADLDVFSYAAGGASGDLAIENRADLSQPHAFASFKGLAVLDDKARVHFQTTAHHAAAHGTSRQLYKSILAGESRSEFDSLVDVEPGAAKADTKQLAKSLLLSDKARARARPTLRIRHDDVACVHGAAVGRLEKDELFYLTSRGLAKDQARLILTVAFAEELLAALEPGMRAELSQSVQRQLGRMLQMEPIAA